MDNSSILWDNNQNPASNYDIPDLVVETHKYSLTSISARSFLVSILLTGNVLCENSNLSEYVSISDNFDTYQSDINFFSKDIKNNIQTRDVINSSIDNFIALSNNWDGFGAIPAGLESAKNARKLFASFPDMFLKNFHDGYPNSHGTISFEWKNNYNDEFFIEIGSKSMSYYYLIKDNIHASQDNIYFSDLEINKVYRLLEEFHA